MSEVAGPEAHTPKPSNTVSLPPRMERLYFTVSKTHCSYFNISDFEMHLPTDNKLLRIATTQLSLPICAQSWSSCCHFNRITSIFTRDEFNIWNAFKKIIKWIITEAKVTVYVHKMKVVGYNLLSVKPKFITGTMVWIPYFSKKQPCL